MSYPSQIALRYGVRQPRLPPWVPWAVIVAILALVGFYVMVARASERPIPAVLGPQEGPQTAFHASPADIVIMGGEAGGGKSVSILLEPIRHVGTTANFTCVIFRRNEKDITNPDGLWAESRKLYRASRLTPREHPRLEWRNPANHSIIRFAHLQYEDTVQDYDGAQICLLEYDQLEHFEESQWWYMLSRNRSTCGVTPYIRASCNPLPDSWLEKFLEWWIEQDPKSPDYGYPIQERSGVLRWFVRHNEELHWFDSRDEAVQYSLDSGYPDETAHVMPKSVTFIPSSVHDNKILLAANPEYLANLMALPYYERMRLYGGPHRRGGNWKVQPGAGKFINRAWFDNKIVEAAPSNIRTWTRYWDKAGTEGGGKYTCGVKLGVTGVGKDQRFFILDVVRGQWSANRREEVMADTARSDQPPGSGIVVNIWVEQEPGSGGKESAENTVANLAGFVIRPDRVTGDKFVRAGPFAAQAEAGNIYLVRGKWNNEWLRELHNADPKSSKDQVLDQMDASAGAFNKSVNATFGFGMA